MKMKTHLHPKSSHLAALLGMSSLLLGSVNVQADLVVKADTGTDLNDPASWAAAVTPTAGDVAVWNGAALGAGLTLGADTNWLGISLSSAASDVDITGAGVLTLGASGLDASLATVNITLGVPVALGAAQTWNVALGFNATANGVVSGAFPLTKDGRGSLTLAGANTYSGGTVLLGAAGSSLVLLNSAALGTGQLDLKSTSTSAGATVRLYGGINVTNPIAMDATTGREAIWSFSGNNTLSGPITLSAGTGAFNLSSSAETGTTLAISNSISGPSYTGAFSLRGDTGNFGVISGQINLNTACQIIGSANWMIASTGNSWTQTRLSAPDGGFILGANDALATGVKVLWDNNSSGVLDMAGFNQTVAGLDCASTIVTPPTIGNSSTSSDSLLKINGGGYTFVGTLVDAIGAGSRTLSLELLSGVQTLSGYNTYSGSTVLSGGTLRVNNALAGSGAVTVKTNATLAGSGTVNGPVTVNSGGAVTAGDATGSGTLTLSSLTLGATGTDKQTVNVSLPNSSINVNGPLVANGTTTINLSSVGTVPPGVYALITYSGPMVTSGFALGPLPLRMSATLQYNNGAIAVNVTSSSDSIKWTGAESGLWNTSALNWELISAATATTYVDGNPGDAVLFDDSLTGASNVVLNTTISPATVTFSNFTTAYTLGGSGTIAGTNALTKLGTGSLTLNTSNSFSGNVTLTGGSLIITNGSALGSGTKILTV
ncbi:MAG: beta strand repeat-containing protein, partial [Verrucomicrobiota bacterium]